MTTLVEGGKQCCLSVYFLLVQEHHLNGKLRPDLVRRELNPEIGKEIGASASIL